MRRVSALVLAIALSLLGVGQALAAPATEPARSGVTASSLLSLVTQVGDDTFSTADLTTTLNPSGSSPTQHYGPFPSSSPDSSTCGNDWAQDTFDRHFTVRADGNNTFTTTAGASPGGCDTNPGGMIVAGKTGDMHGYEIITVMGPQTSTSPNCGSSPCTTAGFLASHFAGAPTVGTYFFHYSAGDQSLAVHEWKNASCDRGGNDGDIASTSPTGIHKSPLCP